MARGTLRCPLVDHHEAEAARSAREAFRLKRIFFATSSRLPTRSAPRGERPASNCPHVLADQPHSQPMRFIIAA
jgi:hypothetical protein